MTKKTIEIKGVPFSYNDEDGAFSVATLPGINKKDAEEILNKTKDLFEQINLKFVLTFGTLLGAIRENGIIDGDEDVDVYITDEERLFNHLPFLYENGLKIIRIRKGKVYSFRLNDSCYIDVYILHTIKWSIWSLYCYSLEGFYAPKKYFKGTETINFLNGIYNVPKDPEKILEWWYGKDWRIPQSTKGRYEVFSRHLVRKISWKLNYEFSKLKRN